jgi:hypothetical protein
LKRSYNKHGHGAFKYKILEVLSDDNLLTASEDSFISYYRKLSGRNNVFNIRDAKRSGKDFKMSAESNIKKSLAMTGRKRSQSECKNISKGLMDHECLDERKHNIRLSKKHLIRSVEAINADECIEYESLLAVRRARFNKRNIIAAIKNKWKSKGFHWRSLF